MGKLLRAKDIVLLTLAGVGDLFEEIRDPMQIASIAYKEMYGFIPKQYVRHNFYQAVSRSLKTGDIEKVIKNGKAYIRLTTAGKNKIHRDFPIIGFSRKWNRKWVIIIFDIEEKSRNSRDILRNKLKNVGFGMLQKSVWITPLPITKDMMEFVNSNSLDECSFILEVSDVLLGDPKELARKIWHLDEIEDKQIELEKEKEEMKKSIKSIHDRRNKIENFDTFKYKSKKSKKSKIEAIRDRRIEIKKKQMELMLSLPFLFKELLPDRLGRLF